MATVQPWTPMMNDKIWTEEEKEEWLATHGDAATHVVTFEPMYQIEMCIPPWEHPDRQIARSAVAWGRAHEPSVQRRASRRVPLWSPRTTRATRWRSTPRVTPRPRLHRVT